MLIRNCSFHKYFCSTILPFVACELLSSVSLSQLGITVVIFFANLSLFITESYILHSFGFVPRVHTRGSHVLPQPLSPRCFHIPRHYFHETRRQRFLELKARTWAIFSRAISHVPLHFRLTFGLITTSRVITATYFIILY